MYFKGLYIEDKWQDDLYPVIRLDFSLCRMFQDLAGFKKLFESVFYLACKKAGFDLPKVGERGIVSVASAFNEMLQQSDATPVLLLDEYDAPLNSCLHDAELFEQVRMELFAFYDILKLNSSSFRLIFITGICRYKNLGIFSGLNFIKDISLNEDFGALLGYTQDELIKYFKSYIENAASLLHMSFNECLRTLELHYDGYCFDQNASTHVFTPWSVLNFLIDPNKGFQNYWYDSAGHPTVLLNYIKSHSLKNPQIYGCDQKIYDYKIDSSQRIDAISDLSLLVQAGYLTIKSADPSNRTLTLNYPNVEVSRSMSLLYLEELFKNDEQALMDISSLKLFATKSCAQIVKHLSILFNSIDYAKYPIKNEAVLRSFLQIYLIGSGITGVEIKKHNSFGRSDLEFRAGSKYYVIELKYAKDSNKEQSLLAKAKAQIQEKHYGESAYPSLKHVHLALVFSAQKRTFSAWECF